jgi:hypothetical protein
MVQNYQPALTAAIGRVLGRNGYRISPTSRGGNTYLQVAFPADVTDAELDKLDEIIIDSRASDQIGSGAAVFRAQERIRALPFRPNKKSDPVGMLTSAFRPYELHPEQRYLDAVVSSGDARILHLEQQSTTCEQKLKILQKVQPREGWTLDRVIAVHVYESSCGPVVMVGPRLGQVNAQAILCPIVGDTRLAEALPRGMERGTGTPVMLASTRVEKLVLLDASKELMQCLGDYSIGGYGPRVISPVSR